MPSVRVSRPRTTTRSPSSSPWRISVISSSPRPRTTSRRTARWPSRTKTTRRPPRSVTASRGMTRTSFRCSTTRVTSTNMPGRSRPPGLRTATSARKVWVTGSTSGDRRTTPPSKIWPSQAKCLSRPRCPGWTRASSGPTRLMSAIREATGAIRATWKPRETSWPSAIGMPFGSRASSISTPPIGVSIFARSSVSRLCSQVAFASSSEISARRSSSALISSCSNSLARASRSASAPR